MNENISDKKLQLVKNAFFSVFSWVFPLALAFFATPVLIESLGNRDYGFFTIALTFLAYAFTSGVGKVAGKFISEYIAEKSGEKLSEAVSMGLWAAIGIGLIQALVIAIASRFIVSELLLIEPEFQEQAIIAIRIVCVAGLVMMVGQVFQSAIQGIHRFDIFAILTSISGFLLSGGNIVLASYGYGLVPLIFWNLIVVTITGLAFFVFVWRLIPQLRFRIKIRKDIRSTVSKYAGSIVAYQFLGCSLFIFERILIVRKFGVEDLPHYVIPMMLTLYMHGMLASILSVIFPVINELLDDLERLRDIYRKSTKIVVAIVFLCVTGFIFCGKLFLSLWISEIFSRQSYRIFVAHGVTFGISAIGLVVWNFSEAFKAAVLNALSTIVWVGISVPLMLVAAEYWNLEGIAVARLIALLFTIPFIFYVEKHFLKTNFWRFWTELLLKISLSSVSAGVLMYVVLAVMPHGWISLICSVIVGTITFCIGLIVTRVASPDEQTMIKKVASEYLPF